VAHVQEAEGDAAPAGNSSKAVITKGGTSDAKAAQQEQQRERAAQLDRLREDPFAAMLAARTAVHNNDKFIVKTSEGAHGGYDVAAGNQQLLADEVEEEVAAPAQDGG
jgi:hypothetical protein